MQKCPRPVPDVTEIKVCPMEECPDREYNSHQIIMGIEDAADLFILRLLLPFIFFGAALRLSGQWLL